MYQLARFFLVLAVLLFLYSIVLLALLIPWVWVVLVAIVLIVACKKGYQYTAYGTARWSSIMDVLMAGMLGGTGMILGYMEDKRGKLAAINALFTFSVPSKLACRQFLMSFRRKPPLETVRLNNAVHTIIVAPTGVGKGVSCVIPMLLTCPDSMVVVDFKGENYKITAAARRRMGHRVVVLDPFGVSGSKTDTFNPLDFIDPENPLAIDEARALAESLVLRTGQEKEPHWNDSAEIWIAAMISAVVAFADSEDRSLQAVRTALTNPAKMQAIIELMCGADVWQGMLSRLGHQLTHFKDKELGSTLTTTNRHLRFLDTVAIANNTRSSTFDPVDLRKGKMTIYLILPPEHMRTQSALLRMWITSLMRAVVRSGLQEKKKIHFILDEAASLGHMDSVDDALDKYRGYGIRLQFYFQSLGQIKKCFPEQEQVLLSNVTQVYFGVNDYETAKSVSDRLGKQTIVVKSGGSSSSSSRQSSQQGQGGSNSYSSSSNDNWQQAGRELLQPDEVIGLDPRVAITFAPGVPPIATWLARYYEPEFERKPRWFWPAIGTFVNAVFLLAAVSVYAAVLTLYCDKLWSPQPDQSVVRWIMKP